RTFTDSDVAGDARLRAAHAAARRDLAARMRRVVGPLNMEGVAGDGELTLETLAPGATGYGMLDGLVYSSSDGRTRIVATTSELLFRWLWARKPTKGQPLPFNIALEREDFYTYALYPDAFFLRYAALPIKQQDATFATAMLFAHVKDFGPTTPDEIVV